MSSPAAKIEDFASEIRQNSEFVRDKMDSGGMDYE